MNRNSSSSLRSKARTRDESYEDGSPVELTKSAFTSPNDGYKRPFDLAFWIAAHVLGLPVWIMLWLTISIAILTLEGRPIFYISTRVGKNEKRFKMYKFRTMVKNAEAMGPSWTCQGDPRVTSIGRILRKTGLDELPQVWSILRGDMSFVGPRPWGEETYKKHVAEDPEMAHRTKVRPGLTSPAVLHQDRDDPKDWLAHDLRYIRNMSPWLDLTVLVQSCLRSLTLGLDRKRSNDAT